MWREHHAKQVCSLQLCMVTCHPAEKWYIITSADTIIRKATAPLQCISISSMWYCLYYSWAAIFQNFWIPFLNAWMFLPVAILSQQFNSPISIAQIASKLHPYTTLWNLLRHAILKNPTACYIISYVTDIRSNIL